jgi:hypothetical protein
VSLKVDAGTLFVRNGFTPYPQKQETYRYFKGDADLQPRIIMLDGSGTVSPSTCWCGSINSGRP